MSGVHGQRCADPTCFVLEDFELLNIQFRTNADIKYERNSRNGSRQKYQFAPNIALFLLLLLKKLTCDGSNISFRGEFAQPVIQICRADYCFSLTKVMDECNERKKDRERVVILYSCSCEKLPFISEFKRIKDIKMFIRQFWRSGKRCLFAGSLERTR